MIHRPINNAIHIFTRVDCIPTVSDQGWVAGVCCSNKIRNHHFVICWVSIDQLHVYYHIASSQRTSILFGVMVYFLRNYLGLHQTRTYLVVCCVTSDSRIWTACSRGYYESSLKCVELIKRKSTSIDHIVFIILSIVD